MIRKACLDFTFFDWEKGINDKVYDYLYGRHMTFVSNVEWTGIRIGAEIRRYIKFSYVHSRGICGYIKRRRSGLVAEIDFGRVKNLELVMCI